MMLEIAVIFSTNTGRIKEWQVSLGVPFAMSTASGLVPVYVINGTSPSSAISNLTYGLFPLGLSSPPHRAFLFSS